jgi:hypothetical protein
VGGLVCPNGHVFTESRSQPREFIAGLPRDRCFDEAWETQSEEMSMRAVGYPSLGAVAALWIAFVPVVAPAAWEPTRPVELIVPAGTGGGADQIPHDPEHCHQVQADEAANRGDQQAGS